MPPKSRPKKTAKHAVAKRQTMLRKLGDPNDKDDPRWVKCWLLAAEVRLARKEKAKDHRRVQSLVGRHRSDKPSLEV